MIDPITGMTAAERAVGIAQDLADPEGCAHENLSDFRLYLNDLLGLPLSKDASRALTAAIYHLDSLESTCRQLCMEIRTGGR